MFYKLKVQDLRVSLSIYWGPQYYPIAPFAPSPGPGSREKFPGMRRTSRRLWGQEEHRASAAHESPRQTNLFFPSAGSTGSHMELQFELYLMRKEPLGAKGDFSMPVTVILQLFCVKAETWGSKIPGVLSQFIRAYLPSLTTFISLSLLLLFHLVNKHPHKHQTPNTLPQHSLTDSSGQSSKISLWNLPIFLLITLFTLSKSLKQNTTYFTY